MYKLLFLLAGCALFGHVSLKAQTLYPSGVSGVIARYDFNVSKNPVTSLPDVSGNGNHSSVAQNLSSTTGWRNTADQAMSFNGVSSYALIPHKSILSPQAITMVALVRFDGFYSGLCQFSQVVCKGYPGYISGQYALAVTDDVSDNDCSAFDSSRQQLIGYFNNSYTTPGMRTTTPGNYIVKSKWYLLAISFNGTQLMYYQVPMDTAFHYSSMTPVFTSANISNPMGANTQDVSIGNHSNPAYPYWFNGKMDELVLFNKVLTASELQSVYDYLWGWQATEVGEVEKEDDFKAYALNGRLTVSRSNDNRPYSLSIHTVSGQKLYGSAAHRGTEQIDLSAYASQVLIVTAKDEERIYVRKVLLQ